MTKLELIARLNAIADQSNTKNGEEYTATAKEWTSDNGKSRTYFKVSRTWRNKYQSIDYGFYDNVTGEYTKGQRDLAANKVFDFGGNEQI
jgi:hypothetical protein